MVGGILLTLLLLSILVFVHELGHFIAAKLMGIRVLEFALFMGPKIFSVKRGETVYSIRCIPIGGFCSMEGEEVTSEDDKAYSNKAWYKKALVLIAGPAMNIILALILTIIFFASSGYASTRIGEVIPDSEADKLGIKPGDKIVALNGMGISSSIELGTYETIYKTDEPFTYTIKKADGQKVDISTSNVIIEGIRTKRYTHSLNEDTRLFITEVTENSLADQKGITAGDKIISLNGAKIDGIFEWGYYKSHAQYPLVFEIEKKSGEIVEITLPDSSTAMGVKMDAPGQGDSMNEGVFTVLGDTVEFTYSLIKVTIKSIAWLFTGKASANDMTGPVGMVSIVSDTVTSASNFAAGLINFIILAILISVNLGVFNILPFPALDGGRLVFAIIEGIRGKKIKPEHEGIVSLVGFVILIGLSILIFINDIIKLF